MPAAVLSNRSPATRGATVEVEALTCRYGRHSAVENVSFSIAAGERVALIGGNGSGKSTVLRSLLGLHRPQSGRMIFDGQPAGDWIAWRRRVAWVPQFHHGGLFPLRVDELVGSTARHATVPAALAQFALDGMQARLTAELSGGQRQRAYLARAWAAIEDGATLLLADEPTASLDFDSRDRVAAWIAQLPVGALVVTHDTALAACCDRVLEMAAGRLREARR